MQGGPSSARDLGSLGVWAEAPSISGGSQVHRASNEMLQGVLRVWQEGATRPGPFACCCSFRWM
jgi:hypothetical protein